MTKQRHGLCPEDREFRVAFESGTVAPAEFGHSAHLRLAYVYLAEHDVDTAARTMRASLLAFLALHGVDPARFHETLTRAWILAVRHFMDRSPSASAADFIAKSTVLLDSRIMLTHYSPDVLFAPSARASFVEPDLAPIPRPGGEPALRT
jgi:hypothetical protein